MNTQDNGNNANKNVLPLNDFLAINEDYAKYKTAWEKKNNKELALGTLSLVLPVGIIFWMGFTYLTMILLLIFIVVFAWYMASTESKNKRELEEYGAKLYKEYLKTLNT